MRDDMLGKYKHQRLEDRVGLHINCMIFSMRNLREFFENNCTWKIAIESLCIV